MNNRSDVKVMLKEAAVLTVITLIAGILLGFVYELTKEPIKEQKLLAVQKACKAVFSQVEDASFEEMAYVPDEALNAELAGQGVAIGTVYRAYKNGSEAIGYVIQTTSSQGYGGDIVLYVGVTEEGKLNDVSILSISETPGLGMQAGKVLIPQLHDKQVDQFTYTKTGSTADNELDAISGATITTKAVTNAVNGALRVSQELGGGAENE